MRIAVIGTGNVGRVLGRRWAAAGHDVCFGSRRPGDQDALELAASSGAELETPSRAAADAEIVVLAVPGTVVEDTVEALGDLAGKIIIDPTNLHKSDLTPQPAMLSRAERIAELAPAAHVVKAFNTTGSKNMEDPEYPGGRLTMPYCGDDPGAKSTVEKLISQLGFDPVDNGPLVQSYALEGMAQVWIGQAFLQEWGPDIGFVLVKR